MRKICCAVVFVMMSFVFALNYSEAAEVNLNDGLLVHYDFEEDWSSTGYVIDKSGNGNNGYVNGNPIQVTDSVVGNQAAQFSNDYFKANANPTAGLTQVTISLWFKTADPTANYKLTSAASWQTGGNGSGFLIGTHYPELWTDQAENGIYDGDFSGDKTFVANEWNHLLVLYDGQKVAQYINGELYRECPATAVDLPLGVGRDLEVGAWSQYSAYDFMGEIDEYRVYNRALNDKEVQALYNAQYPVALSDGLVVHYDFEDAWDSTGYVEDKSGNGNNGYANGSPLRVTDCVVGNRAAQFSNSYFQANTNPTAGYTALTVSLWFKTDDPTQNYKLSSACTWSSGIGSGWNLGTHYPELWSDVDGAGIYSGDFMGSAQEFVGNEWNHLVMFYDGNRVVEYINGDFFRECPVNTPDIALGAGLSLEVGAWSQVGFYFSGEMDQYRVYNRAVNPAEVQALYDEGINVHLDDGLLVHYDFEDNWNAAGYVEDKSGNNQNGYVNGDPIQVSDCVEGNYAAEFSNDYFKANSNPTAGLTETTISLWFKTDDPTQNYKLTSAASWQSDGTGSGFVMGTHYPELWTDEPENGIYLNDFSGEKPFVAGAWNHFLVFYDGERVVQYINGQMYRECLARAVDLPLGVGRALEVGAWSQYSAYNFYGLIDQYRVYNRAVTASEVAALYSEGKRDYMISIFPELDNFENRFAGDRTWWDSDLAVYSRTLVYDNSYMGDYGMQVSYDKGANLWPFFAYDMGRGINYSNYDTFSFVVKGDPGVQILVKFADADWDQVDIQTQPITGSDWQRLSFSLAGLDGVNNCDFDQLQHVLFFVAPGTTVSPGSFMMDEVQFSSSLLATPEIDPIVNDDGSYTVRWNDTGAAIYEIWQDKSSKFVNANQINDTDWRANWPLENEESYNQAQEGTYYYRVRGWTDLPENGGVCTLWSDVASVDVAFTIPEVPVMNSISDPDQDGNYSVTWSDSTDAYIYELWESTTSEMTGDPQETNFYWPFGNFEPIQNMDHSGITYYYRVRAWSDLPENGGRVSQWSDVISYTVMNVNAPLITVTSPQADVLTTDGTVVVSGNLSELATVNVNGEAAMVESDLSFSKVITLTQESNNTIEIEAEDSEGNTSYAFPQIYYEKVIPNALIIDNFDGVQDRPIIWFDADGTQVYSRDRQNTEQALSGTTSQKVEYDKGTIPWSYFSIAFQQDGVNNDFSDYPYLYMFVRPQDTGMNLIVKVQDVHGNTDEISWGLGQVNHWNSVWFNINTANVDMSQLAYLLFFVDGGQENVQGTFWMDEIKMIHNIASLSLTPNTPTWGLVPTTAYDTFTLNWSNELISGARYYILQESTDSSFSEYRYNYVNTNSIEMKDRTTPGTLYYRVRACSGTYPELGNASEYSDTIAVVIE